MRIVFAGTPPFSVNTLQALISAGHNLVCVYTQPDRKTGRGQKIIPTAVKICAQEHRLNIRQPNTLKLQEEVQKFAELKPDLMVVVAYGLLLPKNILAIPKYGCLNIHASLLPKWRGAAPIQRAIEAGDTETGVCIMQMDTGLDTGDILLREPIKIQKNDTTASMHGKLSELGVAALMKTINLINANERITASKQNDKESTYAAKITKNEADINWSLASHEIDCRIRAFNPWPVCQTHLNDKRVRIWFSENVDDSSLDSSVTAIAPGTIIAIQTKGIIVRCGQGAIYIKTLQLDGAKALDHQQFVNGHSLEIGTQFV